MNIWDNSSNKDDDNSLNVEDDFDDDYLGNYLDDDNDNNDGHIINSNESNKQLNKKTYLVDDNEDEKVKVLKTKDQKIKDQLKDIAKKLVNNFNNISNNNKSNIYQDMLENFEKLLKLQPQINKIYENQEIPKLYSKSLYLLQKKGNLISNNLSDEAKKPSNKIFLAKLRKSLEDMPEEITNIIEDYEVDKDSNDELDYLIEQQDIESDNDDNNNKLTNVDLELEELLQKSRESTDPAIRRIKWVKKEYRDKYLNRKKNNVVDKTLNNNVTQSTVVNNVVTTSKKEKIEKIEKQQEIIEEVLNDDDIEKEYSNKLSTYINQKNRPANLIDRIEYLLSLAKNNKLKVKLIILCLSFYFDSSQGVLQEISLSEWRNSYNLLIELNKLTNDIYLEKKDNLVSAKKEESVLDKEFEEIKTNKYIDTIDNDKTKQNNILNSFQGSILILLDKLSGELYKSLQFTNNTNPDYIERIKDEIKFVELCFLYKKNGVLSNNKNNFNKSQINLLILQYIYYKNNSMLIRLIMRNDKSFNHNKIDNNLLINKLKELLSNEYYIKLTNIYKKDKHYNVFNNFSSLIINDLIEEINNTLDNKSKIKAILYKIYNLSINLNYRDADILFKKTNYAEIIQSLKDDYYIKVLYNRTIIQIGYSAFINHDYFTSKYYLTPICSQGISRLRDNLCQANENLVMLDKEDKRKLMPYVMTINIDSIESIFYLTCIITELDSILLERLGQKYFESFFKKQLESFERQVRFFI